MANISYIGFDSYSKRYCYKIEFKNEFDRIKFESNFNMNYSGNLVKAEIDKFQTHTEKVVFAEEIYKDRVKVIIEGMI